jgi:hypothetical protein
LNDSLVREEPNADGASVGIVSVEVDGACPRLGDDVGCLPHDLLVRGALLGMPGSATMDDVIPAPDSSGATGPEATRLLLSDSLGSPLQCIDWIKVEDNMKFICSQVAIMEGLLWDTLSSAGRNILQPIWVSLEKRGKCLPERL